MTRALVWFRRDLRLADNPALQAALDAGLEPVPVFVHAPAEDGSWPPGRASNAWLARSLAALTRDLQAIGSGLIVRQGDSLEVLGALAAQVGATAVFWNRLYEPSAIARDSRVLSALRVAGLWAESFNGALLAEPWTVETGAGAPYRVFTPYWRNASQRLARVTATQAPTRLPPLPGELSHGDIAQLGLAPAVAWDQGFWDDWLPGESGALELLDAFVDGAAHGYKSQRDLPDRIGTSRLSPHLHFGEISPRQIVARLDRLQHPPMPEPDRTAFLAELGWREFACHLLHHFPHTSDQDLSPKFAGFKWETPDPERLAAWQQGRTGVPMVDAGMRELWHTGWMHNRVRMLVASFLTRNLRYHWRHGARWFWDTLVDADLANNSQGWQWSAGTGADAAPYFRIFSPVAQAQRFDPAARYIHRWVPELRALPAPAVFAPWQHPDQARQLAPLYPAMPIVDPKASRDAALDAYQAMRA
ncbi:MAG: deoxyribodipyrimidine photo-lyase [Pseudoxanthomonas sp.]